jgi:hypothetical protein
MSIKIIAVEQGNKLIGKSTEEIRIDISVYIC